MNKGRYVFSQLCDFLPTDRFEWLVKKYDGNKYVKSFTCWNHLLVLLYGQLSDRERLRDLIVSITPIQVSLSSPWLWQQCKPKQSGQGK